MNARKTFAWGGAGGARKEMLVTLSNEAGFQLDEHFGRLVQGGAIGSFEMDGKGDDYLKRERIVLADGVECTATVLVSGERTDITTLRLDGSADFDDDGFRRFVVAINPLWAGMNDEYCVSSPRPICSNLAHLYLIPHFPQFSYWSRRYDALFAGKLPELSQFDFCRVQECADGFWVEIKADGIDDLDAKRRVVERFLVSDDMWDGGACGSNAVGLALRNAQRLTDAVAWKERWRKECVMVASERQEEIIAIAIQAVRERGVKRREGDMCSITSNDDGSIGIMWVEAPLEWMEGTIGRGMAAGTVNWAAILCDFVVLRRRPREVAFTAMVYDSLMNRVKSVKVSTK